MNCKKCGAVLLPNDTFCGSCGEKVLIQSQPKQRDGFGDTMKSTPANPGKTNSNSRVPIKPSKKRSALIVPAIAAVVLVIALLITGFNFLLMTDRIDIATGGLLDDYRNSLSEILNIAEHEEETTVFPAETVTEAPTNEPAVSETVEETTLIGSQGSIPTELQQYANGLTYEGKTYRVTLKEDDWFINYRSSPQLIDKNKPENNVLGKLKCKSEIFVEYIYNDTWAVFYKDGKYVFSSIYASNDPSLNRLMERI